MIRLEGFRIRAWGLAFLGLGFSNFMAEALGSTRYPG